LTTINYIGVCDFSPLINELFNDESLPDFVYAVFKVLAG
jgi:hypothetical protein